MKKKIFNFLFAVVFVIPCLMLVACGNIKSLNEKTMVYSKIEVTGSLVKSDYEDDYKDLSFIFSEDEVVFSDGLNSENTYNYKLEDGRVYIKAKSDSNYKEEPYAEMKGKYMVVSQTLDGGTIKVYFKAK